MLGSAETRRAFGQTDLQKRGINITLWVLQVLAAAAFVFGAVPKVTSDPLAVAGFDAIGFGDWFRYLIGTLEIAGAVALLIPRLCGLAGLAFVGLMIGAVVTQIVVFDGAFVVQPAVMLVIVAIIAWGRRGRTRELIRSVLTRA